MQTIIPAIIPESLEHLELRLHVLRNVAERVQIDVMDGTFTADKTWPYDVQSKNQFSLIVHEEAGLPYWQDFDFEIDLLLMRPEERMADWAIAGAACLIVHMGTTDKIGEIVDFCSERRVEVALAIKPSEDIEVVRPWVERVAFVQVMGNDKVGYHGVALDPSAVRMIERLHATWPHLVIGVDIGVSEKTLPELIQAGARRFAAGSAVFNANEPRRAVRGLEEIVQTEFEKK